MSLADRISRVVRRCRAFYSAATPGHFLVLVKFPVKTPASPPLNSLDLDRDLERWLDALLASARPFWDAVADIDDDRIPAICPWFGIAEHSAWLGMDVRLQEGTSLSVPIVHSPADLDRLTLSEQTPWFRRMKDSYDYLHSRKDGTFLLSVRGAMAPMELANAIRGNDLFTDFLLEPQFAHRLMAFCTQAERWYYERLVSWCDAVEDGHVMSTGSWMGPRCMGHLANDAAMLCSARIYEEFGFPYEAQLVAGYDTVLYHVHNEKMHFVPRLVQLPGLKLLEVTCDPKTPQPIADLPRIKSFAGDTNLRLVADSDDVRAHLEELKDRNALIEVRCRDRADAQDVLAFVRGMSKPLVFQESGEGAEP